MKYTIRAVKYFLSMAVIVTLILVGLTYYATGSIDISQSLDNGWTSVIYIAAILVVFSAVYPSFGYRERPLDIRGEQAEMSGVIRSYMDTRGYRLEKEENGLLTFRNRSPLVRFFRVWEDRVTFTPTHSGYTIEGLNRDIVRFISGIEYKYQNRDLEI
ncbi:MAG: hypothetical protein LIQ26_05025 [Bacteroidota bacterium]|nr:hypothetical protein [Bacteroidota bacterium]